jgi:hypothetical protein
MRRFRLPILAALALLGVGCNSTPESVLEVSKHTQPFIDIRNVTLIGQARAAYSFAVPGDVAHPHFQGRWSVHDTEKPVEVFVFRSGDYDENQPLTAQTAVWSWTLTSDKSEMHIHPTPGSWIVVFFNPATAGFTTRTELTAQIDFSYFK